MLHWAMIFFVIALIAGAFGFGNVASASDWIARLLFYIFSALCAAALVAYVVKRGNDDNDT